MQSQRGVTYTATAIDPAGAPVVGAAAGPRKADIHGTVQPASLQETARVPFGAAVPVMLTTTPHGNAWQVQSGPFAGQHVPYHHRSWSVNPPGSAPKGIVPGRGMKPAPPGYANPGIQATQGKG